MPQIRALKFSIFLVGQVGHRALELGNYGSSSKVTRGQNTQLGLASVVGVARSMRNFN